MNTRHTQRNRRESPFKTRGAFALQGKCAISASNLRVDSVTTAKNAETLPTLKKAEMQDLAASLDYRLALAELRKQSDRLGQLPGKYFRFAMNS